MLRQVFSLRSLAMMLVYVSVYLTHSGARGIIAACCAQFVVLLFWEHIEDNK